MEINVSEPMQLVRPQSAACCEAARQSLSITTSLTDAALMPVNPALVQAPRSVISELTWRPAGQSQLRALPPSTMWRSSMWR